MPSAAATSSSSVPLEICVDSVVSSLAAAHGGAARLELCDNLYEGGTTPSLGLLKQVLKHMPAHVEVHAMIRPRGGDFLYSVDELEVMRDDVRVARSAGAHGVVLGVLTAHGCVDEPLLRQLVRLAAPLPVTFHRAIDVTADPVEAVEACVRCGVARVLTSGGAPTAAEGVATLRRMVAAAAGRLAIAAGGGVSEANAARLVSDTGADELHGSLRVTRESAMAFRPHTPLPMGAAKVNTPESEFETREADAARVAAVVAALAALSPAPRRRCAVVDTATARSGGGGVGQLLLAAWRGHYQPFPFPLLPLLLLTAAVGTACGGAAVALVTTSSRRQAGNHRR